MKGKVESVEKTSFVDTNGNEYYNVTIDGKKGNYACKAGKAPYFVAGQELEYEEEVKLDKNGNPRTKFKKPQSFNGFGQRKPIMLSKSEALRMCKSNAVHAVSVVNAAYNSERLTGAALAPIVAFTSEKISGDIEKYSDADSDFVSRLAAVNNAAIQASYRNYESVTDLLEIAKKIHQYVSKP